jgi:hypothetical protein
MCVRRYRLSPVCHPTRVARLTILETFQIVRESGGEGQNRTVDTTIFSRCSNLFQVGSGLFTRYVL